MRAMLGNLLIHVVLDTVLHQRLEQSAKNGETLDEGCSLSRTAQHA